MVISTHKFPANRPELAKGMWGAFLRDKRGFTLIEVIMVMIFSGIALLAVMNTMSESLHGSLNTEVMTLAADLANEKMERIFADKKTLGYAYINSNNYPDETNASGQNGFSRSVTITTFVTYKKVEVRVSHLDISDCLLTALLTNY